jgi:hypothetical protein
LAFITSISIVNVIHQATSWPNEVIRVCSLADGWAPIRCGGAPTGTAAEIADPG